MSVEFPLYHDNMPMMSFTNQGEFRKLQELDRDRGLINPPIRDGPVDNSNYRETRNLSGVPNQNLILQNNYDPNEELNQTDLQALQTITDSVNLSGSLTEIQRLNRDQDTELDPRINDAIHDEAVRIGSNIYNDMSEDFVDDVQRSLMNYIKERDLYIQTAIQQNPFERLIGTSEFSNLSTTEGLITSLFQEAQRNQENVDKANQSEREKFVKKGKPPLSEQLITGPKKKGKLRFNQQSTTQAPQQATATPSPIPRPQGTPSKTPSNKPQRPSSSATHAEL